MEPKTIRLRRNQGYPQLVVFLTSIMGCADAVPQGLQPFPAGYIDSPYVMPDESAIYFIHSVASTLDILVQNPSAQPVTPHLPNHQARKGAYWWNTDIYVSFRNTDGSWGRPQNLGAPVNSKHMEGGPWVNKTQTMLIFTRESVTDPALSGIFLAQRRARNEPWGTPKRLPGELGLYGNKGYTDFHLAPSGNLYFWSELLEGNGTLYWAKK
jgi:hypothetical protein